MESRESAQHARHEISQILMYGDRMAAAAILPHVYGELRRLAAARLARERRHASLNPTALVHEAYLRLVGEGSGQTMAWNNRGHFFGAAAIAMRRILVERARRRAAKPNMSPLTDESLPSPDLDLAPRAGVDLIDLDTAMTELEQIHARPYRVVMLRYFAGLGVEETAAALDVATPTVKRDWSFARAWLLERISRLRP